MKFNNRIKNISKISSDKKRYIRKVDTGKRGTTFWVFGDFSIATDPEAFIKQGSYIDCEATLDEYELLLKRKK